MVNQRLLVPARHPPRPPAQPPPASLPPPCDAVTAATAAVRASAARRLSVRLAIDEGLVCRGVGGGKGGGSGQGVPTAAPRPRPPVALPPPLPLYPSPPCSATGCEPHRRQLAGPPPVPWAGGGAWDGQQRVHEWGWRGGRVYGRGGRARARVKQRTPTILRARHDFCTHPFNLDNARLAVVRLLNDDVDFAKPRPCLFTLHLPRQLARAH